MYQIKTYEEERGVILADYQNQIPGADISEGSDIFIKASVLASAVWGLYQHQEWIRKQEFPDEADINYLEKHAGLRGMNRKQASKASGTVKLTGTDSTVVTAGLTLKTDNDIYFNTTTGGTIAAGVLDVTAQAQDGGVAGNLADALILTVQDPPAGVDSTGIVTGGIFTGGVNIESKPDLSKRHIDDLRQPPAGGNNKDYKSWALEVEGVNEALVFSLRRGNGTVDLCILTSGNGAARIPSAQLLTDVETHIVELRPNTVKDQRFLAPTALSQDTTCAVKVSAGYTFAQVQQWVDDAITAYLNKFDPLQVLYVSQLERVISDVEGVDDRTVTVPAANVTPTDDTGTDTIQMIVPGTITVTEAV